MLDVLDLVLTFVLDGNVLPRRKERPFLHLTVLHKQGVHGDKAAEVEHVDAVLHRHLASQPHPQI